MITNEVQKNYPNITLALLAGGKASRMDGANKALLSYCGEPFAKVILLSLGHAFPSTVIVANCSAPYARWGVPIVADIFKNRGPLGGIHAALYHSTSQFVFVVPCDMPLANIRVAKRIINEVQPENYMAYVPRVESTLEPLFAIYSRKALATLESILNNGGEASVRSFIERVPTHYVNLPATPLVTSCFTNINTESDLQKLERM